VNKANQYQKNIRPRQVTLYRNVFYSRVSTAVVFCLCASFLLQPIERIYASEITSTNNVETTPINLAVDAGLSDEITDNEVGSPAVDSISGITSEVDAESENVEAPEESEVSNMSTADDSESDTSATDDPSPEGGEGTADSNNGIGPNTATTSTTTVFTEEEIQDLITDADELPDAEMVQSTTSATTTENLVAISNVYSDAVMQFNRNDCVTVEDGSFYCQNKKTETEQGTDGMYALQDKDGDLEIFLQKNGELAQLTFNTVDDASPVFDAKSNTIVWHRLVDERYQIISFDLETNTEVQLTADNVNNMEPSRSGDYTVWQRWHNNNWDIVLYDGSETKFLTDSSLHDIAPNVKGDLVMWNRLSSDNTQTIELYDLVTGEYTTITDEEGGALSNPRMVLVYETQFANGDVVTKGYDVKTGEVTSLANDPGELPEELPEPDPMDETRALVQPKNPVKEDSELSDDVFPPIDPNFTGASSTATTTVQAEPGDLLIASSSPYIAGSTPSTSTASSSISDFTLDLNPPVALNPEAPTDLVVLPFVPGLQFVDIETSE
jgi:hypothetical protein